MPTVRLPLYCPHKPSPKQLAFLAYNGLEGFYGGAASGGKTDALLMGALQYVDKPNYAALILRRSYTDLALPGAIMDRAKMWLRPYLDRKEIRWDRETHCFTFPSGAELAFGYIATSDDKYRYQSAELQYIAFDEVCEFPEEDDYTFMFSRLRRVAGLDAPLRMRCASNPVGVGAYWVKKRFVDEANEECIFLPAFFTDNDHIDQKAYLKSLEKLHPSLQEALIRGNWAAIEGIAFPNFDPEIHLVEPMQPPEEWRRWEGMDFGVRNPTCWLAAALSPRGDLLIHDEYYSPGLIGAHSSAILTLRYNKWGEPIMAMGDPSIQIRTGFGSEGKGETVHSEFAKNGIYLKPGNNDRRDGKIKIDELLGLDPSRVFPDWHPKAGEYGAPRLYISKKCRNLIEQLRFAPIAPIDTRGGGEIVDPSYETRRGHAIAALRYLVTARILPEERQLEVVGDGRRFPTWRDWSQRGWREIG